MNVLVVEPGYLPYEKEINGLEEMQATVGGYIQAIYPYEEPVAIVCNEEGILEGLDFNRSVPGGYGGVFGTFFTLIKSITAIITYAANTSKNSFTKPLGCITNANHPPSDIIMSFQKNAIVK